MRIPFRNANQNLYKINTRRGTLIKKSITNVLSKKKRKIIPLCFFGVLISGIFFVGCNQSANEKYSTTDTAMGTIITVNLYGKEAESVSRRVFECIRRLETDCYSHRIAGSEVYEINEKSKSARDDREVEVNHLSDRLTEVLTDCLALSSATKGAFDVTIRELTALWDIDRLASQSQSDSPKADSVTLPEEKKIQEALQHCGYTGLSINHNSLTLRANTQLDLGAVGKGIALDEIEKLLLQAKEEKQIDAGVIIAGGSVLTFGEKEDGTPWNVAVVDPMDTGRILGVLEIPGGYFVSTSGDYERYVEIEGKRYHHIIDPHTGYPANSGVKSVTILCKSGFYSDALSTACFVLGIEEGLKLAEDYDAYAVFVDEDGKVTLSKKAEEYFYLSSRDK